MHVEYDNKALLLCHQISFQLKLYVQSDITKNHAIVTSNVYLVDECYACDDVSLVCYGCLLRCSFPRPSPCCSLLNMVFMILCILYIVHSPKVPKIVNITFWHIWIKCINNTSKLCYDHAKWFVSLPSPPPPPPSPTSSFVFYF